MKKGACLIGNAPFFVGAIIRKRVKMFGEKMFNSDRPRVYWNWQRTAAVVIAVFAVLQFFRANRPRTAAEIPAAPKYTTGTIVDAQVVVPPHEFVSYRAEFNRRTNLKGEFQTGSKKVRVECLLLDAENFELWKSGLANKSIAATSYVPGGKIIRVLEPGVYFIVVSNRDAPDADLQKTVRMSFAS